MSLEFEYLDFINHFSYFIVAIVFYLIAQDDIREMWLHHDEMKIIKNFGKWIVRFESEIN